MDIVEQQAAALQARSTSGLSSLGVTTALGLALALSQPTTLPTLVPERGELVGHTLGTSAEISALSITEADLFAEINRIYDDLLKAQVDLDLEAKRMLYGSLWDLYS